MRFIIGSWLIGCLALLATLGATAQMGHVEFSTPGSDSVKVIEILNNDRYHFKQIDSNHTFQTLVGHVELRQGKTLIFCDSLIMYPQSNYMECFENVHIND